MYLRPCSSSNSSPFYALCSISFYDIKLKIGSLWVELSLPEVLQDSRGKVTVGWGLALVSLTRMVCTLQGGVGVLWHTMRTRALSWKKEMSPQCQVHKLWESISTFTQNLLNLGVLLLYQKKCKVVSGPLKLCWKWSCPHQGRGGSSYSPSKQILSHLQRHLEDSNFWRSELKLRTLWGLSIFPIAWSLGGEKRYTEVHS